MFVRKKKESVFTTTLFETSVNKYFKYYFIKCTCNLSSVVNLEPSSRASSPTYLPCLPTPYDLHKGRRITIHHQRPETTTRANIHKRKTKTDPLQLHSGAKSLINAIPTLRPGYLYSSNYGLLQSPSGLHTTPRVYEATTIIAWCLVQPPAR